MTYRVVKAPEDAFNNDRLDAIKQVVSQTLQDGEGYGIAGCVSKADANKLRTTAKALGYRFGGKLKTTVKEEVNGTYTLYIQRLEE